MPTRYNQLIWIVIVFKTSTLSCSCHVYLYCVLLGPRAGTCCCGPGLPAPGPNRAGARTGNGRCKEPQAPLQTAGAHRPPGQELASTVIVVASAERQKHCTDTIMAMVVWSITASLAAEFAAGTVSPDSQPDIQSGIPSEKIPDLLSSDLGRHRFPS